MKTSEIVIRIFVVISFLIISTNLFYFKKREELAASIAFLNNYQNVSFEQVSKDITITTNYPVDDNVGMIGDPNIFKVVNKNKNSIKYQISINNLEETDKALDLKYIRYTYKMNDGEYIEPKNIDETGIIYIGELNKNSENTYYIKFWIDKSADNEIVDKILYPSINLEKISK